VYVYKGSAMLNAGLLASGFTDFVDALPFGHFDIGLRAGGTVVAYAADSDANEDGVFGDGTTTAMAGEVETVPGINDATAIAACTMDYDAGPAHMCAIRGAVWCWGDNGEGELGIGTLSATPVTTPTAVAIPGNEKVVSIAAGLAFTCAVTASGKVYAWGENDVGQLGSTPTPDAGSTSPVQVMGLTGPASSVAARTDFACAVMMDGTVECWGNNDQGQLGNGTLGLPSLPGPVVGLMNTVQVATGSDHACARLVNGNVACWGSSYDGQSGTGATGFYTSPQQVSGL
jgi:alpha-tubulin suppressor-like RCC1 family protein